MPVVAYAEKADPDSIYADDDRASQIAGTRNEQACRYSEILWLEQKLHGPVKPHKEERLRKALVNCEALYEAQWIELEMAVGSRMVLKVRGRLEEQQDFNTNFISPTRCHREDRGQGKARLLSTASR
jgi:hypothetical protein